MSDTSGRYALDQIGDLEIRVSDWGAKGLFEHGSSIMFVGESGALKSFIAIDLICCIAAGIDFHGHKVKQGPVIYYAAEAHDGVVKRIFAWCIYHKVDPKTLPLFVSRSAPVLTVPETMKAVAAELAKAAEAKGSPILLCIDTWARSLGGDENNTLDATEGLDALDRLAAPYGSSKLIVHHVGHADKTRARGAYAVHAAMDTEYLLTKTDAGIATMTSVKTKDGKSPDPLSFELKDIYLGMTDEDGLPVSSAVIVDAMPCAESPEQALRESDRMFLSILEKHPEGISASTLAATAGKAPNACRAALSRLAREGLAIKRSTLWYPTKAHQAHQSAPGALGAVGAKSAPSAPSTIGAVRWCGALDKVKAETAIAAVDDLKGGDDDQIW